jgi:predicted nucleic acid-binding protein
VAECPDALPLDIAHGSRYGAASLRRGLDLVRVEPIDAQATALRIFNLHLQSKLSSYDCEFVMLAELLGCKLASGDQAIAIAFPDLVRTI